MATIDLTKLYILAFGGKASSWQPGQVSSYKTQKDALNGMELYMPTQLQISKPGQALELWKLPNEPIIGLSLSKSIVKTEIDGQKGTFKEQFSVSDYKITIRGLAIQEDESSEEYPEELVRKIRRITELGGSLKVVNDLLSIFGIDRVVIENIDYPDFPGYPSVQPYVISCLSDQEFDLELKERGLI